MQKLAQKIAIPHLSGGAEGYPEPEKSRVGAQLGLQSALLFLFVSVWWGKLAMCE